MSPLSDNQPATPTHPEKSGSGPRSRKPRVKKGRRSERLAREYGVCEKTVRNWGKKAELIDRIAVVYGLQAKADILAGRKKVKHFPMDEPPPPARLLKPEQIMRKQRNALFATAVRLEKLCALGAPGEEHTGIVYANILHVREWLDRLEQVIHAEDPPTAT